MLRGLWVALVGVAVLLPDAQSWSSPLHCKLRASSAPRCSPDDEKVLTDAPSAPDAKRQAETSTNADMYQRQRGVEIGRSPNH
jgi:hypothetical protein